MTIVMEWWCVGDNSDGTNGSNVIATWSLRD